MSTFGPLIRYLEPFQRLPQRPQTGKRYELHDGEVVIVPPPRPLHMRLRERMEGLLEQRAGERGVVTTEFPYRPEVHLALESAGESKSVVLGRQ